MSIRLTLSAFRVIRRPFSQPHPKQSPAASGQPPILLTIATIAWYRIPRAPPTCSVPQPRGTEPSKAPQRGSVPYHTHVRKQKPRNPNTHPRPNGPWYGTEHPKPRFQHSVPQLRGTEPAKAPQRASVPYHTPRFIVVKRSSRVLVLYTCPAVPLMRHTPCINYMLRKFVVIMCVSTVKY